MGALFATGAQIGMPVVVEALVAITLLVLKLKDGSVVTPLAIQ